jgi:UDP-N-acetylglucosamine 2-epimerase (non-hydrolysing)
MLKVMTIVGTRPELIKMSRVIYEFDQHTEHTLVHTGQNYDYELNQVFFEDLGIRSPDYFLDAVSTNVASTIGQIISKSDAVMEVIKPDAVLLYGDTNSCLAVLAAKRRKIPVFHFEAGNRCFDQRVPEELNRKVLDHLSDINLVLTENSRRYLIAEGVRPETIIKTGSNMREVLDYNMSKIDNSSILDMLNLKKYNFFLVSMHREENVDSRENLMELLSTLNGIAVEYDLPIIVSTHPRTQHRINNLGDVSLDSRIRFLKPFGFSDYVRLQLDAKCILSDSGTITEEASMLNLPAITIRNSHERPEGMDVGTLIMSGLTLDRVLHSIDVICKQHNYDVRVFPPIKDYENPSASKQILRIVMSYADYVMRTVWKQN